MKFILLVEGYSERDAAAQFLKKWLDPKLSQRVRVTPHRFHGYGDFWNKAVKVAQDYLRSPEANQILGVIGLLDLYGPKFYPKESSAARVRLEWATAKFEQDVNHEKFRMFFAVHEFEAWILSQPSILPFSLSTQDSRRIQRPEEVDFESPPSSVLVDLYKRNSRTYKKRVQGKQLLERLDPEVAYQKCPNLKKMLDTMLSLAKQSGL
jgi:hypothetical protein